MKTDLLLLVPLSPAGTFSSQRNSTCIVPPGAPRPTALRHLPRCYDPPQGRSAALAPHHFSSSPFHVGFALPETPGAAWTPHESRFLPQGTRGPNGRGRDGTQQQSEGKGLAPGYRQSWESTPGVLGTSALVASPGCRSTHSPGALTGRGTGLAARTPGFYS